MSSDDWLIAARRVDSASCRLKTMCRSRMSLSTLAASTTLPPLVLSSSFALFGNDIGIEKAARDNWNL
ncbi:MAG: hypothetical protein ABGZ35_33000, partial [Planctomycetaceae bacterium]